VVIGILNAVMRDVCGTCGSMDCKDRETRIHVERLVETMEGRYDGCRIAVTGCQPPTVDPIPRRFEVRAPDVGEQKVDSEWQGVTADSFLWRNNMFPAMLMLVEDGIALAFWHDARDATFLVVIIGMGAIAEAVFVGSGVWQYVNPSFFCVALWFGDQLGPSLPTRRKSRA